MLNEYKINMVETPELQLEVSQARLDDLSRQCGRFDELDARGLGAAALPLGQGRYAVTIRSETGLAVN